MSKRPLDRLALNTHLILASSTFAKILTFHTGHIAPFMIRLQDFKQIGVRVETGMTVHSCADSFSWER